jgi:hypothetical protein
MLDTEVLKDFMKNFFGYGDLNAPVWFVGMEEGGGASMAEIEARLATWVRRGRKTLEDVAIFHEEFGDGRCFSHRPPLQSTWKELMRVVLIRRGEDPDNEALREYQRTEFARTGSGVALLELMPLPKPSIASWPYAEWTDPAAFPQLSTIRLYRKHTRSNRIEAIRALIRQQKPKTVLFYGQSYRKYWEMICERQFEADDGLWRAEDDMTLFIMCPHPAAHGGVATACYKRAAELLRDRGI